MQTEAQAKRRGEGQHKSTYASPREREYTAWRARNREPASFFGGNHCRAERGGVRLNLGRVPAGAVERSLLSMVNDPLAKATRVDEKTKTRERVSALAIWPGNETTQQFLLEQWGQSTCSRLRVSIDGNE